VAQFPLGQIGPFTALSGIGGAQFSSIDAFALAGGSVYTASTYVPSACYEAFQAMDGTPLAPLTSVSSNFNATVQLAAISSGSTLYAASAAGYLVTVTSNTATQTLDPIYGMSVYGAAVSQDSPTSTLWLSSYNGSNGYLLALSVPSLTNALSPIPIFSAAPGGIAIAP
jgi:hypothetical protein